MNLSNVVYFGAMLLITILVQSCEDKISAKKGSTNKNFPSQIIYNTDIVRRDSGNINLKFRAKIIEKYEYVDSPFIWSILIRKKQKNQGKYGLIMQFSMKKRIPMRQKEMCGY